jgi:predicted nuclease of predicted toxin-antitoxin system
MKILLDENLPVKLKYRFEEAGFSIFTVRDMRWLGKENGELLRLMLAEGFTTFITIDNNLSFQQNFVHYPVQVLVLIARDNTYETVMEFFPEIVASLAEAFTSVKAVVHPSYIT